MIRRRLAIVVAACIVTVVACHEKSTPAESESAAPPAAEAPKAAASITPSTAPPTGDNLLAAANGVAIVGRPSEYSDGWAAYRILDGDPDTGWASAQGAIANQTIVIESPESIRLESIVFDTRKIDGDGRAAKDVTIEVSDTSRTEGFAPAGSVTLRERQEDAFSLENAPAGRWIRFTIANNNGATDYTEIMDVRGYGKKLTNILDQPSLTSFSAGATIAVHPSEYSRSWSALMMLDENPGSGWASKKGSTTGQSVVIALPTRTELTHLVFDTGGIDGDGRGAKQLAVSMSDTSESEGFRPIATVELDDRRNVQLFPVSASVPGRWLRVDIVDNHGATDYTELMEIRGMGKQLEPPAPLDINGTYRTEYGAMHLRQEGTSVSGCYEHADGLLSGGVEGRVMKLEWRQSNGSGPAIMVFPPDGKRINGLWWYAGATDGAPGFWDGEKVSDDIGRCAHWTGGAQAQLAADLESEGRAVVYGINFDVDSDAIRAESKPTLDKIVAVLNDHPSWKLLIEGHTDSTGGAEHNQDLSERRAAAVKRGLEAAGIDGERLTTSGFGATQPVATNDTPLGRAQNRRVELKKQ